jgi:hypothetical protein
MLVAQTINMLSPSKLAQTLAGIRAVSHLFTLLLDAVVWATGSITQQFWMVGQWTIWIRKDVEESDCSICLRMTRVGIDDNHKGIILWVIGKLNARNISYFEILNYRKWVLVNVFIFTSQECIKNMPVFDNYLLPPNLRGACTQDGENKLPATKIHDSNFLLFACRLEGAPWVPRKFVPWTESGTSRDSAIQGLQLSPPTHFTIITPI